jgi:hypothetical protein
MLQNTPHPILRPTPSKTSISSQNVQEPTITLPPPISHRVSHQRSRTTVDLPPLFNRTPSSSPTRSSTFLPFLRHSRDRSISPERVTAKEAAEFDVGLTPPEQIADPWKTSGKVEKLASWFNGCSDPVNITLVPSPSREKLDPIAEPDMNTFFSGSTDSLDTYTRLPPRKRPGMFSESANASTSRLSLFRKTSQAPVRIDTSTINELADIDAFTALFPTGEDAVISAETYKSLQVNAESTIKKLQQALKQQTQALNIVTSQKNAQADDMEAIKMQSTAMKDQLNEMADQVKDQEEHIQALKAELSLRPASFQAETPTRQTVRMVSGGTYRRKRISDTSMTSQSDDGSEMSSPVSVFSEVESLDFSPGTSIAASPVLKNSPLVGRQLRPSLMWSDLHSAQACQRCHGVPASDAWDVIDIMKKEKVALRDRIEVLEGEYESALNDLVGGLTISVDKTRAANPQVLSPLDEMQQRIRVSLAHKFDEDE